jgi:hypothetical protein
MGGCRSNSGFSTGGAIRGVRRSRAARGCVVGRSEVPPGFTEPTPRKRGDLSRGYAVPSCRPQSHATDLAGIGGMSSGTRHWRLASPGAGGRLPRCGHAVAER